MVAAVGGALSIQKLTKACCPMPTGLGITLRYAQVGIVSGGVWALVVVTSNVEAIIEVVKIAAIKIAKVVFFRFCILYFSSLKFY